MMKYIGDLRFVIGSFFSIVGVILLLTSFFGPSDLVRGIEIKGNLWTGLVILTFGVGMLILAICNKDEQ